MGKEEIGCRLLWKTAIVLSRRGTQKIRWEKREEVTNVLLEAAETVSDCNLDIQVPVGRLPVRKIYAILKVSTSSFTPSSRYKEPNSVAEWLLEGAPRCERESSGSWACSTVALAFVEFLKGSSSACR